MKKMIYKSLKVFLFVIGGISMIFFHASSDDLFGRDEGKQKSPPANAIYPIKNYAPVPMVDPDIRIKQEAFSRSLAENMRDQYLEITCHLENLSNQPKEIYAFIFAYYETNAANPKYQKLLPPSKWRKQDRLAEAYLTHYLTSTPSEIPINLVWDKNEYDYRSYRKNADYLRIFSSRIKQSYDFYPPIWKYLEYGINNPQKGLKFTLRGGNPPPRDQTIQTDYVPPTVQETREQIYKSKRQLKYTLYHSSRSTILRSHHYHRKRRSEEDNGFYNRAAILLLNADENSKDLANGRSEILLQKVYSLPSLPNPK